MAFVIASTRSQVCIDGVDEPLLAELPGRHGLRTPRCDYLSERFYGDPQLGSPAEVALLRAEIEALRAVHAQRRHQSAMDLTVRRRRELRVLHHMPHLPVLARAKYIVKPRKSKVAGPFPLGRPDVGRRRVKRGLSTSCVDERSLFGAAMSAHATFD
jgi:hypothetical protein